MSPRVQPPKGRLARATRRGFTLVELVIVILILGILTGVAVPKVLRLSSRSVSTATLSSVRIVFDAAEVFAARNGVLPRSADPGDFPTDFEGYVSEKVFTEPHELGGHFGWNGSGTTADDYGLVLSPSGPASSWSEVYFLLEESDDGLTSNGWITLVGGQIRFRLDDKSADAGDVSATGSD